MARLEDPRSTRTYLKVTQHKSACFYLKVRLDTRTELTINPSIDEVKKSEIWEKQKVYHIWSSSEIHCSLSLSVFFWSHLKDPTRIAGTTWSPHFTRRCMSIMESWWPWSQLIKSEIGVLCRYCVVLPWISLPVLPVLPVSHMSHLDHVTCPYFSGSSSSSVFLILVIQGIKRIYTATIAPVIWNNRVCVQVFRLLWKCRPVTRSIRIRVKILGLHQERYRKVRPVPAQPHKPWVSPARLWAICSGRWWHVDLM